MFGAPSYTLPTSSSYPPSCPLPGELQDLVRSGVLHPSSAFWQLAFEGVLLELLDAHGQVRLVKIRMPCVCIACRVHGRCMY